MTKPDQELIETDPEVREPLPALPGKPQEALLSIIQGVTLKPDIDTSVIEKLWVMQQQAEDRDAEQAYWAAMPKLQAELPLIPKNGKMQMSKGDSKWTIPFARFEDVIEAIRPIMKKNGFSLTFKHRTLEGGDIHTTGIVAHKKGHKETDEFVSEPDTTGSKNKIQAVGSARSYGKRYTTGSLLGLAFGGEDDDGESTGFGAASESRPPEEVWDDETFDKNFPKWQDLIVKGERTIGDIMNMVATKGKLTDGQKEKLRSIDARNQQ